MFLLPAYKKKKHSFNKEKISLPVCVLCSVQLSNSHMMTAYDINDINPPFVCSLNTNTLNTECKDYLMKSMNIQNIVLEVVLADIMSLTALLRAFTAATLRVCVQCNKSFPSANVKMSKSLLTALKFHVRFCRSPPSDI